MALSLSMIPIGVLFLGSGLLVNFLQLLTMILLLPFSRNAYRIVNIRLMDSYWSQVVWLLERWGHLETRVYADPETWSSMGNESALVICNHRSDVDWAVGWILAERVGVLGSTRAFMKRSVQFLPVIGWSMWFSEYMFLARNWAKDQSAMKKGFTRLASFPRPMWIVLFVEGTRFTPEKLQGAKEYAASAGLPVPRHTLVPRTKGFVMSVQNCREFVPFVYDITVMVPQGSAPPTFAGLFHRKPTTIDVHIRRVPITELPQDEHGISKWCRDAFLLKDDLLEKHIQNGSFGEEQRLPLKQSIWPVVFTTFWSSLILSAFAWLCLHSLGSFELNWTVAAVVAALLLLVSLLLHKFVQFTQSERSTPMAKSSVTKKVGQANGQASDKKTD